MVSNNKSGLFRLRARFGRGGAVKFISHLDIIRLWMRTFVRADIPLAYTEGFNPRPRLSLAAPLSVGTTSEAELMDVVCRRPVSPHFFRDAVNRQLPDGITVFQTFPVGLPVPSLQAQMRFAEYRVELPAEMDTDAVQAAIAYLLEQEHLPWQHRRDTGIREYDLRPLVEDISLEGIEGTMCSLKMKLRCSSAGSGRPEQVTAALGFRERPITIHRTGLILEVE